MNRMDNRRKISQLFSTDLKESVQDEDTSGYTMYFQILKSVVLGTGSESPGIAHIDGEGPHWTVILRRYISLYI